jgi:uncharacterized Ntn-hydrolase superfamily protein
MRGDPMRALALIVVAGAALPACGDAADRGSGWHDVPAGGGARGAGYCRRSGTYTVTAPGGRAAIDDGAPAAASLLRPVHTYSIVARDPATGELGVAVQSHWFSVGSLVTWAEPGVGAVATQSFVEPAYGPRALALLATGVEPAVALAQLVAADAQAAVRQVAVVDAQGRAAAHTGDRCIQFAGHHVGAGYSVQANLMGNDKVVPAMARAFETTGGDLAGRLMAALDAAQGVGGDIRGCQSAALLVVSGTRSQTPWTEKRFDLRVEDSPAPLDELRRLLVLARAYEHMNKGDLAVERKDMAAALDHYGRAAGMVPDSAEMVFWTAITLATHGEVDRALPMLKKAFAADPAWRELVTRLPKAGLIPETPEGTALVERILRETR